MWDSGEEVAGSLMEDDAGSMDDGAGSIIVDDGVGSVVDVACVCSNL